ncbi:putative phage-like protein YoqJ [Lachnospiraceae bacterium PF1-22]
MGQSKLIKRMVTLRKKANMRQVDLSELVKPYIIPLSTVKAWETGAKNPADYTIALINEKLVEIINNTSDEEKNEVYLIAKEGTKNWIYMSKTEFRKKEEALAIINSLYEKDYRNPETFEGNRYFIVRKSDGHSENIVYRTE